MKTLGIGLLFVSLCAGCGSANINVDAFDDPGTATSDAGADAARDDGGTFVTDGSTNSDSGSSVMDSAPVDTFDPTADLDGDGYAAKDDCDDKNAAVNPGAYDIPENKIDDDCNGKVDDLPDCDNSSLKLDSADATDFAKSLGLCKTTTADATGKDKTWGVISAKLVHADGTAAPKPVQYGLQPAFGKNVTPRRGKTMVALSSGTARTPEQTGFVDPKSPSFTDTSEVMAPAGFPKSLASCPAPSSTTANDSVALELEIRTPTNANGLQFAFDYYTSEYLDYVCTSFNDHFLALLESKVALDAKYDGDIAVDDKLNPITSSTSFLAACTAGSKNGLTFDCPLGTHELEGTGFLPAMGTNGAATSWLETRAATQPGETIKIRFVIFDVGDHILDSTVLLDDFRWLQTAPASPSTSRPAK